MKEILIYSSASCDWNTREGQFFAALEYQGKYKYLTGPQAETTADRCILTGLLEAAHLIREPCKVKLITATRLSFNRLGQPKGSNKELKQLLLDILHQKQCMFEFDVWAGRGDRLKARLCEIEEQARKVPPVDVLELYRVGDSRVPTLFEC